MTIAVCPVAMSAQSDVVGTTTFVTPSASGTLEGGNPRALDVDQNSEVYLDERLNTSRGGRLQVEHSDGSALGLAPNSSCVLNQTVRGGIYYSDCIGNARAKGGESSCDNPTLIKTDSSVRPVVIGLRCSNVVIEMNDQVRVREEQERGNRIPVVSATLLEGGSMFVATTGGFGIGSRCQQTDAPGGVIRVFDDGGVTFDSASAAEILDSSAPFSMFPETGGATDAARTTAALEKPDLCKLPELVALLDSPFGQQVIADPANFDDVPGNDVEDDDGDDGDIVVVAGTGGTGGGGTGGDTGGTGGDTGGTGGDTGGTGGDTGGTGGTGGDTGGTGGDTGGTGGDTGGEPIP